MKREIITTGDGSKTIHLPEWNEQYHSKHGAIQEARHVFLKSGLQHWATQNPSATEISILEMGFGTGLNALLTFFESQLHSFRTKYTGIEAFPVSEEEAIAMAYSSQLEHSDSSSIYNALHKSAWEKEVLISPQFKLIKRNKKFADIEDNSVYDLIYFDAFGPRVQPDLWTEIIFVKMYDALRPNGILTTYCAQGAARRAMQSVGFQVERLPGPPGKREMLRACKV